MSAPRKDHVAEGLAMQRQDLSSQLSQALSHNELVEMAAQSKTIRTFKPLFTVLLCKRTKE